MRSTETYCHIENGVLKIHHKQKFLDSLKTFPDCRGVLKFEKLYKKRTSLENSYYWGVVINDFINGFRDMTGEDVDKETSHFLLKQMCNYREIFNEETGETIKIGQETKTLTTIEFEEYLERCRNFIHEWFGITVLLPNEQGELFIEEK